MTYLPKDLIFPCGCKMVYHPFTPPEHLKYYWFAIYYGQYIHSPECDFHTEIKDDTIK